MAPGGEKAGKGSEAWRRPPPASPPPPLVQSPSNDEPDGRREDEQAGIDREVPCGARIEVECALDEQRRVGGGQQLGEFPPDRRELREGVIERWQEADEGGDSVAKRPHLPLASQ